jgi:hypothetical protein
MSAPISPKRKWGGLAVLAALVVVLLILAFRPANHQPVVYTEDSNGDGKPDSWTSFDNQGHLLRFEKDKNHDGNIDWRDLYVYNEQARKELIAGNEADLDTNGTFETVAVYDNQGRLTQIARDRNDDGKADIVSLFDDPNKPPVKIIRDDDFDGKFELVIPRTDKPAAPAPAAPPAAPNGKK